MAQDQHREIALKVFLDAIDNHPKGYSNKDDQNDLLEELIETHALKYVKRGNTKVRSQLHDVTLEQYRNWLRGVRDNHCIPDVKFEDLFVGGSSLIRADSKLRKVGIGRLKPGPESEEDEKSTNDRQKARKQKPGSDDEYEDDDDEILLKETLPTKLHAGPSSGVLQVEESIPETPHVGEEIPQADDLEGPDSSSLTEVTIASSQGQATAAPLVEDSLQQEVRSQGAITAAPVALANSIPGVAAKTPEAPIQSHLGTSDNPTSPAVLKRKFDDQQEKEEAFPKPEAGNHKKRRVIYDPTPRSSTNLPAAILGHLSSFDVNRASRDIAESCYTEAFRWCVQLSIPADAKPRWDQSSAEMVVLYQKLFGSQWRTRMNCLIANGQLTANQLLHASFCAAVWGVLDKDASEMPWERPEEMVAGLVSIEKYCNAKVRDIRLGYTMKALIWEAAHNQARDLTFERSHIEPLAERYAQDLLNTLRGQIELLGGNYAGQKDEFVQRREEELKKAFVTMLVLRHKMEVSPDYYEHDWIQTKALLDEETMELDMYLPEQNNQRQGQALEVAWSLTPLIVLKFTKDDVDWKQETKAKVYCRVPQQVFTPMDLNRHRFEFPNLPPNMGPRFQSQV